MRSTKSFFVFIVASSLSFFTATALLAQKPNPQDTHPEEFSQAIRELQSEIQELRKSVEGLRDELMRYRQEASGLRRELQSIAMTQKGQTSTQPSAETQSTDAEPQPSRVEEDVQLLGAKVDEQHQTKVESASKYRVRLSGIVLFNLFSNRGIVDSIDAPSFALYRGPSEAPGSFGGTLRQSQLGLEIFGPQFAGAKTSANIQFDFAGGFSQTLNGVTLGSARMRTGVVRLEWPKTTIVAGQDTLFIAPVSPTSFASLSMPALAYSGNLWAWTPQLRIEHRFKTPGESSLSVQLGVLDPLTGEFPGSEYLRQAGAGEKSGQPAYAAHVGWETDVSGRGLTLGLGSYYSRQNWGFDRRVDAWAATADFDLPLGRLFRVSGEGYRGRAVGGIGGAGGRSVLFNGPLSNPSTAVLGLNSMGGWAQLKFIPATRLEFNGAFGQDNPFAEDVKRLTAGQSYFNPALVRNRSGLANAIFRPRSDLVLSLEYRRIRTFQIPDSSFSANQLNLGIGVLF